MKTDLVQMELSRIIDTLGYLMWYKIFFSEKNVIFKVLIFMFSTPLATFSQSSILSFDYLSASSNGNEKHNLDFHLPLIAYLF